LFSLSFHLKVTVVIINLHRYHTMAAADDYFESFCRQVLSRDYFIRSERIADHVGHLMAVAYRHGLIPLLMSEESSRATAQAAICEATRDRLESKIGEI
jgi:hypothetical protein